MSKKSPTNAETSDVESNIYEWIKTIVKRNKFLVICLLAFWLCWPAIIWLLHCARNMLIHLSFFQFDTQYAIDKYGQLGDMYGVFNALISGMALLGVIYTCYLQKIEIKEDRERYNKKETFENCEKMFNVIQQCETDKYKKAIEGKNPELIMVKLAYEVARYKKNHRIIDTNDTELNPHFEEWWVIRKSVISPSFAFLQIHSILDDIDDHSIQKTYYLQELDLLDKYYIQTIIVALTLHNVDIFEKGWGGYYVSTLSTKTFAEFLGSIIGKQQYLAMPSRYGIEPREALLAFKEMLEQLSKG